jgi:hypothetical protein
VASTNTTAISDDEPLTEAEIEGVLAGLTPEPPEVLESAPESAPKRGRGRPPGSRNKPKSPGIGAPPPPPRARPRSTPRRGAAKGPTTEQKLLAAWGVPVAAFAVAGQMLNNDALRADAITAEHYGAGIAKTVAPIAENSPSFMGLLDRMSGDAAPWVAAAMVVIGMGAQFAVNHGVLRASSVASFGAVPREMLLGGQEPPAPPSAPEPAPAAAPEPVDPWAAGTVPPDWQ